MDTKVGTITVATKIDIQGVEKGSKEIKKEFEGVANTAEKSVDKIEKEVKDIDLSGMENKFSSAADKIGGAMSGIAKSVAAAAAAFVADRIIDFGQEAIDLGSDLQEVQNVVDVTFTSMSGKVNEFAQDAAKSAGLSETMAKKYVGTFGAMADSFGFAEKEAYEMSTTLTQLTGDVASFYNLDHDEAYNKLKSVFTGETEALKELGVVMTQTALDDYAMRNGFKKTVAQMTEQEKVSLRYSFVLEQLDAATGDFVRTQDGWANQTRILNLQWESFQGTIGEGLINAFSGTLQYINNKFMPALQDAAEGFAEVFSPTPAQELMDTLENLGNAAVDIEKKFADVSRELSVNAAMTEDCIEKLEALEEAGLDTVEAQTQYEMTVRRLNELQPEWNLTIDEHTGLVNMDTEAMRANIEEQKNYAKQQAQLEAVKGYYDAYYESLKATYEAQYDLNVLQNEAVGIYMSLADSLGMPLEQIRQYNPVMSEFGYVLKDQAGNTLYLSDTQKELAEELAKNVSGQIGLNAAMKEGAEESEKLLEKADSAAEFFGTTAEEASRASESQNALAESTTAVGSAAEQVSPALNEQTQAIIGIIEASEKTAEANEAIKSTAETLATSYDTAGQAAQASADQQAQAFDAAAQSNTASTETIVKNAESITAGYQKHTKTITEDFAKFNETFLESSEVFAQATDAELQKLTEISEEFAEVAKEFNAIYEQMQETSADTLDSIENDFSKTFDSIYSSVRSDISSIQSSINSLTGKSVNVTVTTTYVTKYETIGSPPSTSSSDGSPRTYNAAPALAAAYEPAAMNALPVAEPYLAEGTVVPPMATFPAAAAFSSMRRNDNEELIREIVRAENAGLSDGLDDINENLSQILGTILQMNLDGNMIFSSYNDRARKHRIMTGVK